MNRQVSFIVLFSLLLAAVSSYGQTVNTEYDMVKTSNGLLLVGNIHQDTNNGIVLSRPSGDTISIFRGNIKKVLHGGRDILFRSDKKYVFLNHLSLGLHYQYMGFARSWRLQAGVTFARNWYLGLAINSQIEESDIFSYSFPSIHARKYFMWRRTRPFIGLSYGQESADTGNNFFAFNESIFVKSGTVEFGLDLYSNRNMKWQFSSGVNLRDRLSSTTGFDLSGNAVTINSNSLVLSYFLQIGFSFKLYSF